MNTYIALFRGINVGGKNLLPMKELVALLERLDLHDVRTYIQSGNAVFRGKAEDPARLANRIGAEIGKRCGFEPRVFVVDAATLDRVIRSNPFPQAESAPNTLHVNFLAEPTSRPDLKALERIRAASERFHLDGNVLYLHAPDGVGRSKLAAGVERLLGVAVTCRNWRTVCTLRDMAAETQGGPASGTAGERIADLPNFGPKSRQMLAGAGIDTLAQLRALGAVRAYVQVKRSGANASLNLLWALEGALSGRNWREVARDDRLGLLTELERIEQGAKRGAKRGR